jgi:hypothetical protein
MPLYPFESVASSFLSLSRNLGMREKSFFQESFCSLFFLGRLFGLLLFTGFGCSLFFNGSFFASLVGSRYPLSSLF